MKKTAPAKKNSRLKKTTINNSKAVPATKKKLTSVSPKKSSSSPSKKSSSTPKEAPSVSSKPKSVPNPPLIQTSNRKRHYSILQVFGEAIRLIGKKPKPIFLTSIFYFIVIILIAVVSNLISGKPPLAISFGFNFVTPTWSNITYSLVSALIGLIFGIGITYYYNKVLEGNRSDRASTFQKSFSRLIPSFLTNFSIFLIMFVVVIPFVILSLSTSIFALYQAITKTDFNALFNFLLHLQFSEAWNVFWLQINPFLFILSLFWTALGAIFMFYVSSRYFFANNMVIVTKAKVGEALSASSILTKGNIIRTMFFQIISFSLNIFGALFFGVGLIFTIPLTTIAQLYAYHSLVGDLPALSKK